MSKDQWDHDPADDETRDVSEACFACDGVEGAASLCRDCLAQRSVEATRVESLCREVEDYARAAHLMRWTPGRPHDAAMVREMTSAMGRLRVLLGGRL